MGLWRFPLLRRPRTLNFPLSDLFHSVGVPVAFSEPLCASLQVYIWVLNEEEEFKRAFDLGATGVMTDYPTKLKDFLHAYPA